MKSSSWPLAKDSGTTVLQNGSVWVTGGENLQGITLRSTYLIGPDGAWQSSTELPFPSKGYLPRFPTTSEDQNFNTVLRRHMLTILDKDVVLFANLLGRETEVWMMRLSTQTWNQLQGLPAGTHSVGLVSMDLPEDSKILHVQE